MTTVCTAKLLTPTTVLVTGPEDLWDWRQDQRIAVPGHEYTPRFKRGQWDGLHVPGQWCRQVGGDRWTMRCSRGLLGRLATAFSIRWEGEPPEKHLQHCLLSEEQLATLFNYQREALLAAIQHQWGRIALATNAGKGAVITLLAKLAAAQGEGVLILCDELAVFDALLGELEKWSQITPGLVQQSSATPPTDAVVLAMVPTLARRLSTSTKALEKRFCERKLTLKEYEEAAAKKQEVAQEWRKWLGVKGMVLLDEADKAAAAGWRSILTHAKNSTWRLGFSGTFPDAKEQPYEDLRLDELMGPILIRARNLDLIQQKVSATPLVTLYGYDTTATLLHSPTQWWKLRGAARRQLVFERAILTNVDRHFFIQALIQPNTPTALVVNRIEHGHQLEDAIPGAVFLDGSANAKQRLEVLTDFQEGKIQVLILTKILDRGTNRLGHVTDLIFVSGEGSQRQTLQRIGRGLRRTGGKEYLRLVDIIDRVDLDSVPTKRGFLTKAADYIHSAARKRIRLYRAEGFEVELIK